jgi:hypothetical protein
VAFIRRVLTASGATAVQIAEYVRGRQQIVEHVGSAHTEAELGLLLQRARELLENPAQGVLELGIEPMPPVKGLIVPAETGLFETAGAVTPAGRDSPGRVVGTDSRILFDALAGVFTALGFDGLGDEVFRDLVIARVVEPTSLLDTGRVLRDLGQSAASYATMKRTLGRAAAGKYRDRIATWCFEHASTSGDISLVLYDVTTLYFEAEKEDELRKVGYSKERRVDPQIVLGLLVDRGGFPLEIGCLEGNKAETATMVPIIKQFQARHNLTDAVVVARRRHALRRQPARTRRGEPAFHRRIPDDQSPGRPGLALPLARRRVHGRATDRHHHPPEPDTRTKTTPMSALNPSGTPPRTPAHGGPCGPTPARERSATPLPSRPRRTGPGTRSRHT